VMFSLVGGAMEAAESGNGNWGTSGEGWATGEGGRSEALVRLKDSEVIRDM